MSWQEELRRLDEELASGRLSADDYRIRRDQVLSSAVGQQDPPPPQPASTNADSTQVIAPVSPPQGVPQPPAQQPPTPPQPVGDQSAERTQAVSWQQQQQQQTPHADVSRTEYVQPQQQPPPQYSPAGGFPQAGTQSPPTGFPQSQPAPWNVPEGDQSPPWGGGNDLGAGGSDSTWSTNQGPEFFSTKPKKGNGKKVGAIVGAVVVLAAVAFGAYWLWGRGPSSSDQPTAGPTQQQAPSSNPKPADPLALGAMPGRAETHDEISSFSQVSDLKYLNPQELSAYQSAGASKVKAVVYYLDNGDRITLFLTQATSANAAKTAAEKLAQIQVTNGAKRDSTAPDGVYATMIDKKEGQSAQVRGHYAHGKVVIRVDVSGSGDLDQVKTDFTSALNAQLTALPADA